MPIVWKPDTRSAQAPPLPPEQNFENAKKPSRKKVWVARRVVLEPSTQTWVDVVCRDHGTVVIEPLERLYDARRSLVSNGVATVIEDRPFRVLVTSFSGVRQALSKNKVLASARPHPAFTFTTPISLTEVLGIEAAEAEEMCRPVVSAKRVAKTRNVEFIEKSAAALREKQEKEERKEEEKATTVEDVDLTGLPEKYHQPIRDMLNKHVTMWSGSLGEIKTVEHRKDLNRTQGHSQLRRTVRDRRPASSSKRR